MIRQKKLPKEAKDALFTIPQYTRKQRGELGGDKGGGGRGRGGGRPNIIHVGFARTGLLPPKKAPGCKACIGPTGEMMHNGRVRIAVPRAPQACTTEIKRIP